MTYRINELTYKGKIVYSSKNNLNEFTIKVSKFNIFIIFLILKLCSSIRKINRFYDKIFLMNGMNGYNEKVFSL